MKKKVDPNNFKTWQKWLLAGMVVMLLAVTGVIMWQTRSDGGNLIELSASVRERGEVMEISAEEYEEKLKSGENFLVLAHSTSCPAGMPLTSVAMDLAHEYGITIYGLMQEEFRKSSLGQEVKFLPSLVVVGGGKVLGFLDAESNEDLPAYKSVEGLEIWLKKYIKL